MIPKYIKDWLRIIEEMSTDNTYKLAWGRAIIESNYKEDFEEINDTIKINFDSIAIKMLKYYWNQGFFFKLKQAPYNNKLPVIQRIADSLVDEYKRITNSSIPVWFDKGEETLLKHNKTFYYKQIKEVVKTLHFDVSYRFLKVKDEVLDIYNYDKKIGSFITIKKEDSILLKNYTFVISQLLNYKWAQLLEKFNFAPRIVSKVKGISDNNIKRNSLNKYKEELLKEFKDNKIIDFYTDKEISLSDVSIDHVIPWSYIYSDDIWNLVITSKSNNSSKSNNIPTEEIINKLKKRNLDLVNFISDDKMKNDLILSMEKDILKSLYYECKM